MRNVVMNALNNCGVTIQAASPSIAQSVLRMSQILNTIWSSTALTVEELFVGTIF